MDKIESNNLFDTNIKIVLNAMNEVARLNSITDAKLRNALLNAPSVILRYCVMYEVCKKLIKEIEDKSKTGDFLRDTSQMTPMDLVMVDKIKEIAAKTANSIGTVFISSNNLENIEDALNRDLSGGKSLGKRYTIQNACS
jgi:hypothetical protein